jgi:N-acetylglucosaminyl-diphospho-decaprenol L-rhamnosyltransferase
VSRRLLSLNLGHHLDLTIIIVNWNGGELLRRCLASVRRQTDPASVQVIVIDNNSADGSREMAQSEFPGMRVINSGGNLGFGKANNLARQYVDTPLVLFLNPDTEVLENTLLAMVSFLDAHPELGALGCKMREADGNLHELPLQWSPTPWTQFLHLLLTTNHMSPRLKKLLPYADPRQSGFVTKLYGGCIMARKAALDAIGWFDERYFMYAEDIDLCHSLLRHGWKLYYLSEAEIIHTGGGTSRKTKKEFPILMMCESIGQLMRKYYGCAGSFLYRVGVLTSCQLRLLLLVILQGLSLVLPSCQRDGFSNSCFKYRLMILWSLKLRKPLIPGQTALSIPDHLQPRPEQVHLA